MNHFIQLASTLFPMPAIFGCVAMVTGLVSDRLLGIIHEDQRWQRAIVDNGAHGLIALLSWAAVIDCHLTMKDMLAVVICGFIGSMIDIDHFLAAKSIKLEHALSLQNRPPFHATSLIFLMAGTLIIMKRTFSINTMLPTMVLVAGLSHHIRDGIRRGLWFPPFGSTPLIPYWLYVSSLLLLPLLVRLCIYYKPTTSTKQVMFVV